MDAVWKASDDMSRARRMGPAALLPTGRRTGDNPPNVQGYKMPSQEFSFMGFQGECLLHRLLRLDFRSRDLRRAPRS